MLPHCHSLLLLSPVCRVPEAARASTSRRGAQRMSRHLRSMPDWKRAPRSHSRGRRFQASQPTLVTRRLPHSSRDYANPACIQQAREQSRARRRRPAIEARFSVSSGHSKSSEAKKKRGADAAATALTLLPPTRYREKSAGMARTLGRTTHRTSDVTRHMVWARTVQRETQP